jgi:hypothetical protein
VVLQLFAGRNSRITLRSESHKARFYTPRVIQRRGSKSAPLPLFPLTADMR